MKNRNYIIDVFRGIAVLLVTSFHIFLWSSSNGMPLVKYFDFYGLFGNGWVGVGIFFVISGYCMGMSTKNTFSDGVNYSSYCVYFSKRFLRIALPYYFSIIFWVILIRCYGIAVKPTEMYDIFSHFLFFHNLNESTMFSISGVYWSLAVEIQFYLALPFIVFFFTTFNRRLLLLLSCSVISVVINLMSSDRLLTWSILSYFYPFILGWFLFTISPVIVKDGILKIIKTVSVTSFVFLLFYKGSGFNNNVKIYELIVSSVAAIAMWSFVIGSGKHDSNPSMLVRVMSFIGKCSFSIYLYNYVFWMLPRENISIYISISSFVFVIAFGVAMYFIVEMPSEIIRKSIFSKKTKELTT